MVRQSALTMSCVPAPRDIQWPWRAMRRSTGSVIEIGSGESEVATLPPPAIQIGGASGSCGSIVTDSKR